MPRYHFHVRSGSRRIQDPEGSELTDLTAAREEAILNAREGMSFAIRNGRDISKRTLIEVSDETGAILLTVPYTEAFWDDGDT